MPLRNRPGTSCAYEEGEMPPILRLWFTSTLILGAMMSISAWLTGGGIPVAFSRLALAAAASTCLLVVMRRWWRQAVVVRLKPLVRTLSAGEIGQHSGLPPLRGSDEISKLESLIHRACCERKTDPEAGPGPSRESAAALRCGLSGNLRLAADHVESIRTLLEVSQTHQQPIPRAAFQNLELVSKNLRDIERQFDADSQDAQLDGAFQVR